MPTSTNSNFKHAKLHFAELISCLREMETDLESQGFDRSAREIKAIRGYTTGLYTRFNVQFGGKRLPEKTEIS